MAYEDGKATLIDFGAISNGRPVASFGEYPWSLLRAARSIVGGLMSIVEKQRPDVVVIEETNLGSNRYSQKLLEYTHALFLSELENRVNEHGVQVVYLDTSAWRHALGLRLDKDQRKSNAKLSKAKKEAEQLGGKVDKKALGIKGKITWKHLSVAHASNQFQLNLKQKDNDIADAINLAWAFIKNAPHCDGV